MRGSEINRKLRETIYGRPLISSLRNWQSIYFQALCRKGNLSTISFSTPTSVFTFDIVKLGSSIFDEGLRDILQSSKCLKVFHNCRQASDLLLHRYDVRLEKVYDTQSAHSYILTRDYCGGYMPKYAVGVAHMARAYFGIKVKKIPHWVVNN